MKHPDELNIGQPLIACPTCKLEMRLFGRVRGVLVGTYKIAWVNVCDQVTGTNGRSI